MLQSGQIRLLTAGALLAATALPATFIATDASLAATVSAETLPAAAVASAPNEIAATETLTVDLPSTDLSLADDDATAELDAELECMAKVVLHEAGNQPRAGQLAVAQLIVNRVESGRFADSVCGVVNQPGQFFQTASYNPRRDTAAWADAVAISREARIGRTADVAPGAMFFRAAYTAPTGFFRTRTRVVTLGDHVFYR